VLELDLYQAGRLITHYRVQAANGVARPVRMTTSSTGGEMLTKIIGRYLPVWALLACLLSGCLVSERPLITESMLPITNGTFVQIYDVTSDGTMTPRRADGRIVVHRLDIIDGAYVHIDPAEKDPAKRQSSFKLAHVPIDGETTPSFWIAMHYDGKHSYIYTALAKQGNVYVEYSPTADDFLKYVQATGRQDTQDWEVVGDKDKMIKVSSLTLLKEVLPEMVAGGFYTGATAYKPVTLEEIAAAESIEGNAPEAPASNAEILDRHCQDGNAEACTQLGVHYADGTGGVAQDLTAAATFLNKGCQAGDSTGCVLAFVLVLTQSQPASAGSQPAAGSDPYSYGGYYGPPPGEWEAQYWCYEDWWNGEIEKPTVCRDRNGGTWFGNTVPWRCDGVIGWCD
jgi:hypothetical protein